MKIEINFTFKYLCINFGAKIQINIDTKNSNNCNHPYIAVFGAKFQILLSFSFWTFWLICISVQHIVKSVVNGMPMSIPIMKSQHGITLTIEKLAKNIIRQLRKMRQIIMRWCFPKFANQSWMISNFLSVAWQWKDFER